MNNSNVKTSVSGKALIIWDPLIPNKKREAIDTDQITPAADCISLDLNNLDEPWKNGAFRYVMSDFRQKVHKGYNFLIVGDRFGIGSSREMSPAALKGIGDEAHLEMIIICGKYLGDIFRGNAINLGLHTIECPEAVEDAQDEDEFYYEKNTRTLKNLTQNRIYSPKPLTEKEQTILTAGGLIQIGKEQYKNIPSGINHSKLKQPKKETLTLTEQILWSHSVDKNQPIVRGNTIRIYPDLLPASDGTAPLGIYTFEKITAGMRSYPQKAAIINDHFVYTNNENHERQLQISKGFAEKHSINPPYYGAPGAGIFHFYLPENKLIQPGGIYAGADSHSRTYGAYSALGIGIGSTALGFGWATGWIYYTVPKQNRIKLKGKLQPWVTGKDIVLALIKNIKQKMHNSSIEFIDENSQLPISYRHTIANMMAEAEVANAIFAPDKVTYSWYEKNGINLIYPKLYTSKSAEFDYDEEFDLSQVSLQVAQPFHPANSIAAQDLTKERIRFQKALIGSCTNGSYEDLYKAAQVFFLAEKKGFKKVAEHIEFVVYPGSNAVKQQITQPEIRLNNASIAEIFEKFGGIIRNSWCGPCFGQGEDALTNNEVAITSFNRNWQNRMGVGGLGYLASPVVVAASALLGYISTPADVLIDWNEAKKLFG